MKIIDLSKWNGTVDFKRVAAAGIDGVIIRGGYGREESQKDVTFEKFYADAVSAGLHVGAYWYSYAGCDKLGNAIADAAMEAETFATVLSGKKFDLPVYYDIEEPEHVKLGKKMCTEMVRTFCRVLEKRNFWAGVYSFDSFFQSNIDWDIPSIFSAWVARVENVQPKFCNPWGIHQYSWKGKVDGVSGDVDTNNCILNYPQAIISSGKNGYSVQHTYTITAGRTGIKQAEVTDIIKALTQLGFVAQSEEE